MTTRRALQADRRTTVQLTAAVLTCLLALTLATLPRSSGHHHVARVKAVVGVSTGDVHSTVTRSDLHAVATPAAGGAAFAGIAMSAGHPIKHLVARTTDAARGRGPPERAA